MKTKYKQSGVALLIVLILVASATIIGMGYVNRTTIMLAGSDNQLEVSRARYLAESAIYHALNILETNPDALAGSDATPLGPYTVDSTGNTYYLSAKAVEGEDNKYELTGKGISGDITQIVTMKVTVQADYSELVDEHEPNNYWRLGETSGTQAVDFTGNKNGRYKNGVQLGCDGAIGGDSDKSAHFDGVNDYVNMRKKDLPAGNTFSIITWINPVSHSHVGNQRDARIISKATGTGLNDTYWMLSTVKSGGNTRLQFRLRTGRRVGPWTLKTVHQLVSTSGNVPIGQWTFVAVTYQNHMLRIYQNGSLVGTKWCWWDIVHDSTKKTWIGGCPSGATRKPFHGRIDEMAIFNTRLDSTQITELYEAKASKGDVEWD